MLNLTWLTQTTEYFSWIKVTKYISKLPFTTVNLQLQGWQHTWHTVEVSLWEYVHILSPTRCLKSETGKNNKP